MSSVENNTGTGGQDARDADAQRSPGQGHLHFGFIALLVFLSLGFLLEFFHGFRIGSYLSEATEPRRLMWTLAHAHGTLLALIHIALGAASPEAPASRLNPD